MQFLLFDVSATLVFLLGYLTVVTLQRRHALPVAVATSDVTRPAQRSARAREERTPSENQKARPREQCCREWPRLAAPR